MGCNIIPLVIMAVPVLSAQYLLSAYSYCMYVSLSFSCFLSNGLDIDGVQALSPSLSFATSQNADVGASQRPQSSFRLGWDEITVDLDGSYVRSLSLLWQLMRH